MVDVRPFGGGVATGAFSSPASLSFDAVPGLPANTPLVLARYDEVQHAWVAVAVGLGLLIALFWPAKRGAVAVRGEAR